MKCKKCKGATRITDTRSSGGLDTFLVKRAYLYVGEDIPFRVRRHKCKVCGYNFDTVEIALSNVNKLKKLAKDRES